MSLKPVLTGLIVLLGVSLLFGILAPGRATANAPHLSLAESWPKADEELAESPEEVRLRFTEAPQMNGTSLRLRPMDAEPLDIGKTIATVEDDKIVVASIPMRLEYGTYEVLWRAMARDGHVVRGDFQFEFRVER